MTDSNPRLLVVDDDPAQLDRAVSRLRALPGWEVEGVTSSSQALQACARGPFDAVLADLAMPVMGGASLLREIMARYPATFRVILFEPQERDQALACLGWAHQFLAKPIEPDYLRTILQASTQAGSQIQEAHVRELVARIGQLPTVPSLYRDITTVLGSERGTTEMVGQLIERDVAMTAMLLKLANSAYFGLRTPVANAVEATGYLGVELIKSLVLAYGLFGQIGHFRIPTFTIQHLWGHSLAVASAARRVAELEGLGRSACQECFTAGLLHDVGLLVLASRFPEEYLQALELNHTAGGDLESAERQVLGTGHGAVGAYLLALWGLPATLVEAAGCHHRIDLQTLPGFTPALAVHAADAFQAAHAEHEVFRTAHLDLDYLKARGFADRVTIWQAEMAALTTLNA